MTTALDAMRARAEAAEKERDAALAALKRIDEECAEGFISCVRCGQDEPLFDCDIRSTALDALAATDYKPPRPVPGWMLDSMARARAKGAK